MKKFVRLTLLVVFVLFGQILAQNTSFLEFDGDDSFFVNDASNKLDVTGSNWTIEFWVYPTTNTVPPSGTYPAIASRKYSFEVYFRNNGGSGSQLGVGIIALDGSSSGFGIEATLTSGSNELSLNEWHHVAISYDGSTTRMFFDGTEVGSSTDPDFDLDASVAAINFGARYSSDEGYTRYIDDCALDEIRYSKTARYTSNFKIGTSSHPFTADANTILLYHLNENTGTDIHNDNDTDFDTSLRSSPHDATWRSYDYYSDKLPLQFVVDGSLTDDLYEEAATKQNSNSGFGSDIDVSKIVYYTDDENSTLYLGIIGKLNTSTTDGIGIWINSSGASGASSGTSLAVSGGGHYLSGNGGNNPNFKADFEVDYMFALNPGKSTTDVYFDAAKHVTSSAAHYQGSCDQSGTLATNSSADGTVFAQNTLSFAFNNGGGSDQGFEIAIPYSQIGASSGDTYQFFAFVVSASAYFSDVTVPGDVSGGNLGFDPDFSSLAGGPYHSSSSPVPVELTSFTANVNGSNVKLNWETATEINNYGFEVERATENSDWQKIGFVEGAGNSNSLKEYMFTDRVGKSGNYSYRLKQIDLNGEYKYSQAVEVSVGLPTKFELKQNYPNPFNPTTNIRYSIAKKSRVMLKVYDMLGREVATLINKEQAPGNYAVEFDASRLSSGVYFYTLKAGELTATKKMILMK